MPQTIVNNQKWAYYTLSKQGMMVPRIGVPTVYFVQVGSGYRKKVGDPTLDDQALAFLYNGAKKIMPGRSHLGQAAPTAPRIISPRISFSRQGAALQWPPAPEEEFYGYHIERSHEPGHPLWSFRRITPSPITRLTHQDLWAWEGESVSYRIYTVLLDGSQLLRAQLTGVQTPFAAPDKYITAQFIVNGTNTKAGVETVFEGLDFRPPELKHAVLVQTGNPVLFRNCTGLTTQDFVRANGGGNVRFENCLIKGKVPATKNYSAGSAFQGDYQKSFGARYCVVRELAGWFLGQWRGPTAAQGGPITQIYGNVYHNMHRKRSDGAGGTLAERTIASVYREGSVRGQTDPAKSGGFTVPVGWEFAQWLKLNGSGNPQDNLPAQFFGGLDAAGNLVIQEPGRGLGEDAFNFYRMGGEPGRWIQIRGYCVIGNWGNGINAAGQPWQPGMPWHMGGNKQPAASYMPVAQAAGEFKLPFQSMTGGLMQDSYNPTKYNASGAYVLVEDAWLIGPGTMLGTQHSHDHLIRRAKVLYSGTDQSGTLTVTGDPRIGVYMDNGEGTLMIEGQRLSERLGIQDSLTIAPISDNNKLPQGFSTRWTDPALTFGSTVINRFATRAEEEAGYHEFLGWCEAHNIGLGPQYPAPAVVYS